MTIRLRFLRHFLCAFSLTKNAVAGYTFVVGNLALFQRKGKSYAYNA